MKQGDDSALKLVTSARVDRVRAEGFPDNGLADVGGNKEGNARSETVALLKEFVEEKRPVRQMKAGA